MHILRPDEDPVVRFVDDDTEVAALQTGFVLIEKVYGDIFDIATWRSIMHQSGRDIALRDDFELDSSFSHERSILNALAVFLDIDRVQELTGLDHNNALLPSLYALQGIATQLQDARIIEELQ